MNKSFFIKNINDESKRCVIDNNINESDIYLTDIIAKNDLNLDRIYKSTFIKQDLKKDKYQGIYIYLCEKQEKDLYQIYKYLTGNNPIAQNVLLCNKITIKEQITSFLYRAILCEYNSCFIVGGIELLNNSFFSLFSPLFSFIYSYPFLLFNNKIKIYYSKNLFN